MFWHTILCLLLLCVLLCATLEAGQAQEKLLWGDLQPGRYAVGFRTRYEMDNTRLYDAAYPSTPHQQSEKTFRIVGAACSGTRHRRGVCCPSHTGCENRRHNGPVVDRPRAAFPEPDRPQG